MIYLLMFFFSLYLLKAKEEAMQNRAFISDFVDALVPSLCKSLGMSSCKPCQ